MAQSSTRHTSMIYWKKFVKFVQVREDFIWDMGSINKKKQQHIFQIQLPVIKTSKTKKLHLLLVFDIQMRHT